jgi:hypothetical protein
MAALVAPLAAPVARAAAAVPPILAPRVQAVASGFEERVSELAGAGVAGDADSVPAVRAALDRMVAVDQFVRQFAGKYAATPEGQQLTPEERRQLSDWYAVAARTTLGRNLDGLKSLLKRINWVDRRRYGSKADFDARILVQYADFDLPFQKQVLATLTALFPQGGTSAESYADLADAVAVEQRRPQPFGSEGRCTAAGVWQPLPIADEDQLGRRRAELGLVPMSEYVARYSAICK